MDELQELLSYLLGATKDEDLNDPEFVQSLEALIEMLDKKKIEIPEEIIETLRQMPSSKDRFRQAAIQLRLNHDDELKELAGKMKKEGLLKSAQIEMEVLSGILNGTGS
jgi:hypothetical protein